MSMVHKRLFTVVTFLLCFATSLLAEQIGVKKTQPTESSKQLREQLMQG